VPENRRPTRTDARRASWLSKVVNEIEILVVGSTGRVFLLKPPPPPQEFFEKGDQPTEAQFSTLIDSTAKSHRNRELLGLRNFVLKTRHDTVKNSIGKIH
jgi:hypothetical protein